MTDQPWQWAHHRWSSVPDFLESRIVWINCMSNKIDQNSHLLVNGSFQWCDSHLWFPQQCCELGNLSRLGPLKLRYLGVSPASRMVRRLYNQSTSLTLLALSPRVTWAPRICPPPFCISRSGPPERPSGRPHWIWTRRWPLLSSRTFDEDLWRLSRQLVDPQRSVPVRRESSLALFLIQPKLQNIL